MIQVNIHADGVDVCCSHEPLEVVTFARDEWAAFIAQAKGGAFDVVA